MKQTIICGFFRPAHSEVKCGTALVYIRFCGIFCSVLTAEFFYYLLTEFSFQCVTCFQVLNGWGFLSAAIASWFHKKVCCRKAAKCFEPEAKNVTLFRYYLQHYFFDENPVGTRRRLVNSVELSASPVDTLIFWVCLSSFFGSFVFREQTGKPKMNKLKVVSTARGELNGAATV